MQKKILWCIRIFLFLLILCNMFIIYNFSSENAEKSTNTSNEVTTKIAQVTVKDFENKGEVEKQQIIKDMSFPVRKIAHMTEFGTLGLFIFLLALTWKKWIIYKWFGSILLTFLYALTDEYHQGFVEGRGPQFTDVLIDTSGAVILCTLFLLFFVLVRGLCKNKLVFTKYSLMIPQASTKGEIFYITDIHGCDTGLIEEKMQEEKPIAILIGGDLADYEHMENPLDKAYEFLIKCANQAPTFYALGNHEIGSFRNGNWSKRGASKGISENIRENIAKTGVMLLENQSTMWNNIYICGLSSGLNGNENIPNEKAIQDFSKLEGYKLILCHHPEYYEKYLKDFSLASILCGHAHGGHWRIFGRGIYAPGQGLFPKYTSGVIDNKCYISRGAGDHTKIPRFYNPREVLILEIGEG